MKQLSRTKLVNISGSNKLIFEILADVDPTMDIREANLDLIAVGPVLQEHDTLFWGFVEKEKAATREELDQAQAYLASARGWTQMPPECELIPEEKA